MRSRTDFFGARHEVVVALNGYRNAKEEEPLVNGGGVPTLENGRTYEVECRQGTDTAMASIHVPGQDGMTTESAALSLIIVSIQACCR